MDNTILHKLQLLHVNHLVTVFYLLSTNQFIKSKGAEGSTRDSNENVQEYLWALMDVVAASGE